MRFYFRWKVDFMCRMEMRRYRRYIVEQASGMSGEPNLVYKQDPLFLLR